MSEAWNFKEGSFISPELTAMKFLGGGSAYEAYLAFDEVILAPVVVKAIRPDQVEDEAALRHLVREAETLRQANHPGLPRCLRWEVEGPVPHLVLENVDGPRLSTLIRRYGRLEPYQYLPLALDGASVLHFLAQLDIVHLDVKPSNIIMGSPARLIDFSVARSTEAVARLHYPVGTDLYMAPEQAKPEELGPVTFAADVWGLGASLYHAMVGEPPFEPSKDNPHPQLSRTASMPKNLAPPGLCTLVESMLAARPEDRPTPKEVSEEVEPYLTSLPKPKLSFKVA